MTTIQRGKRRCDGTCQGATGSICTCVCGGKNHGKDWREWWDDQNDPVGAKPRRIPKHQREQLALFEGVPAF